MSSNKEAVPENSLQHALSLAASDAWQDRKLAARVLARYADNESAFAVLVRMLDDPDTAVIEESVTSLVVARERRGLMEVLRQLGLSDDNAGYHIRDRLTALWLDGTPVADRCREVLLSEPEGPVRDAALEMIEELSA